MHEGIPGILLGLFFSLCVSFLPGEMGPMVASTLKLGIAILNGGNSTVQQVCVTSVSDMCQ